MWISKKDFIALRNEVKALREDLIINRRETDQLREVVWATRKDYTKLHKELSELPEKLGYKAVNIPEKRAETVYIKVK
jgi:BMFP domain-containing protein YqiC